MTKWFVRVSIVLCSVRNNAGLLTQLMKHTQRHDLPKNGQASSSCAQSPRHRHGPGQAPFPVECSQSDASRRASGPALEPGTAHFCSVVRRATTVASAAASARPLFSPVAIHLDPVSPRSPPPRRGLDALPSGRADRSPTVASAAPSAPPTFSLVAGRLDPGRPDHVSPPLLSPPPR